MKNGVYMAATHFFRMYMIFIILVCRLVYNLLERRPQGACSSWAPCGRPYSLHGHGKVNVILSLFLHNFDV